MNPSTSPGSVNPVRTPGARKLSLAARIAGASLVLTLCGFAQEQAGSLIRGRFTGPHIPAEMSLNTVRDGVPVKHSNVKVAKDGSFGFDFAGTYTRIEPHALIEYTFGGRTGVVEFISGPAGVTVRVTFEAESENPEEMQRQGWQAILNNFAKHVEARL
jgi:hypothetical protein